MRAVQLFEPRQLFKPDRSDCSVAKLITGSTGDTIGFPIHCRMTAGSLLYVACLRPSPKYVLARVSSHIIKRAQFNRYFPDTFNYRRSKPQTKLFNKLCHPTKILDVPDSWSGASLP